MSEADAVRLGAGNATLILQPAIGGAVSRLDVRGISVLRPTPAAALSARNVRQLCSYPLVPYSNRIGNAELVTPDGSKKLRPNFPGEPHAIHGVGWQRAWRVKRESASEAVLALSHRPDEDWPFAFEAEQHFALEPDRVRVRLRVTSLDNAPMPVGLGFHPFFPIDESTTLETSFGGCWQMGGDKLPTALGAVPPDADFRAARRVFDWQVDHCFAGWSRKAVLRHPSHTMTLTASAACGHIVCFAPRDGRNFIALEPVSHVNNAFQLAARGVQNTGMRLLGRGDSFEIGMTLAVAVA